MGQTVTIPMRRGAAASIARSGAITVRECRFSHAKTVIRFPSSREGQYAAIRQKIHKENNYNAIRQKKYKENNYLNFLNTT